MTDDVKQWFQDVDSYRALHGQPHLDAANQNDKDAVEVAKLLIQSLLLLHGGALLAIPTFVSIRPGMDHATLLCLLACFTFGVIAALLAGSLAFFALVERAEAYSTLREAVDLRACARAANLRFLISNNPIFEECEMKSNAAADAIDKAAEPHFARYLRMRLGGIVLVCTSIAALIVAGFIGTAAL